VAEIGRYTVYVSPDMVLKYHKDISNRFSNDQPNFRVTISFICHPSYKESFTERQDKISTPTIVFQVILVYIQVN